jgi:hypothetical protein
MFFAPGGVPSARNLLTGASGQRQPNERRLRPTWAGSRDPIENLKQMAVGIAHEGEPRLLNIEDLFRSTAKL